MYLLELIQKRVAKIIQGMEYLSYEDRLRKLALFNLENRRLWGRPDRVLSVSKGKL